MSQQPGLRGDRGAGAQCALPTRPNQAPWAPPVVVEEQEAAQKSPRARPTRRSRLPPPGASRPVPETSTFWRSARPPRPGSPARPNRGRRQPPGRVRTLEPRPVRLPVSSEGHAPVLSRAKPRPTRAEYRSRAAGIRIRRRADGSEPLGVPRERTRVPEGLPNVAQVIQRFLPDATAWLPQVRSSRRRARERQEARSGGLWARRSPPSRPPEIRGAGRSDDPARPRRGLANLRARIRRVSPGSGSPRDTRP